MDYDDDMYWNSDTEFFYEDYLGFLDNVNNVPELFEGYERLDWPRDDEYDYE